jgi:hypothetical protein
MDIILLMFNDHIWLPLLELFIAIVLIRSVVYDVSAKHREGGTGAKVTRSDQSWGTIFTFWGLSIILIDIIISSDLIHNHRIFVGLLNLGVLVYLNIFSVYFKNKVIGWYIGLKNWSQQI